MGTPAQVIAVVSMLALFATICFQVGSMIGRDTDRTLWDYIESNFISTPTEIKPARINWQGSVGSGEFGKKYSIQALPMAVEKITRSGNTIEITILATNALIEFYTFSADAKSSGDEGRSISWSDRFAGDLIVFPGDSKRRSLTAFLPVEVKQKLVVIDYRITYKADRIYVSQELRFD